MKRALLGLLFFGSCIFGKPLEASYDCGCFSLGIEYLYFKPSIYDPYFAIPGNGNPDEAYGTRFGNFLSYTSGVRIAALYSLRCSPLDLYGEGLYLSDHAQRSVELSPLGFPTKGSPVGDNEDISSASSNIEYRLWSIRGGASYKASICQPLLTAFRVGLHYANLSVREISMGIAAIDNYIPDHDMHSWGVGPEVGVDVGYQICSSLAFMVRGNYGLLVGLNNSIVGYKRIVVGGGIDADIYANNEANCIVSPYSEFKLGFTYEITCGCFTPLFEIGYDIIHYSSFVDQIRWIGGDSGSNDSPALSLDHYSPFMVHGLYVSLMVGF